MPHAFVMSEEEAKRVTSSLSQRDYSPTPFHDQVWEVVGERIQHEDFMPIAMEVLRTALAEADPMFEDFGGTFPYSAKKIRHAPSGQMSIEDETGADVPNQKVDEELLERIRTEAREEGYAQGLLDGEAAAKTVIAERYNELQSRVSGLSKDIRQHIQMALTTVEKSAFELAMSVSKKIVSTTAQLNPEYILAIIREGLQSVGAGKPIRVRVSNDDMEFLNVIGLPHDLSTEETGVRYVGDDNIKSGCVVETNFGEIDLQLERMWEEIKDKLFAVAK